MSTPAVWPRRIVSGVAKLFTATAIAATAATTFGAISARQFGIRYRTLPLLPTGTEPFRILHVGDMHLVEGDQGKIEFVRRLAGTRPDLVVNTGDNTGSIDAVDDVLEALEPLLQFPGVCVSGSNDFYGPRTDNPLRYLRSPSKVHDTAKLPPNIDAATMFRGLTAAGTWQRIDNRSATLPVRDDIAIRFAGTRDAHMQADAWPGFDRADSVALLNVAVTHAPYRRVLDAAITDGADLVLAGHTHGGQIALPNYGAIVSNCDLPTGLAARLFRWRVHGKSGFVNVTSGIGVSPTVPLRTFCQPTATVLDLVPVS